MQAHTPPGVGCVKTATPRQRPVIGSKDTSILCSAPDFRTSRARVPTTAPRSTVADGAVTGRLRSGTVLANLPTRVEARARSGVVGLAAAESLSHRSWAWRPSTGNRPSTRLAASAVPPPRHVCLAGDGCSPQTWEKQVLSARGFKRVGRHSEYAI